MLTFGAVERVSVRRLDEVSDAGFAVEMLTRQNLRLPEVLGAQGTGQLVIQLLETLGKEIFSVFRHRTSAKPSGVGSVSFPDPALSRGKGSGDIGPGGGQASRAKIIAESAQRSQYIFPFTRFGG